MQLCCQGPSTSRSDPARGPSLLTALQLLLAWLLWRRRWWVLLLLLLLSHGIGALLLSKPSAAAVPQPYGW